MKKNKIFKSSKGFTLVEAILAIVIMSIVAVPLTYVYYDSQKEYECATRVIQAQYDANRSIDRILENLRQVNSEEVDICDPNNPSVIFDTLKAIQIDGEKNIIVIHDTDKQIAYGVVDEVLYQYETDYEFDDDNHVTNAMPDLNDIKTGRKISGDVSSFIVKKENKNDPYVIEIEVEPEDVANKETIKAIASTKFVPRFYDIR